MADSVAVRLREAHLDDVEAIVAVVTRAYRATGDEAGWTTESHLIGGLRTTTVEVRAAIDAEHSILTVAIGDEGEVVGCIRTDVNAAELDAHFGLFAVDPTYQSRGVGRALLDNVHALARDHGCATVSLEVVHQRTDLKAWYESAGFRPTGARVEFPYGDEDFGSPLRDDLHLDVYSKDL